MTDNTLQATLQRHQAFWEMEPVEKPLLSVGQYHELRERTPFRLADGSEVQEGQLLEPGILDLPHFAELSGRPLLAVSGDFLRGVSPYDLCWMEAIAGCPIRWQQGSPWSEPFVDDIEDPDPQAFSGDSAWLDTLLELTQMLISRADGHCPVVQPLLRGPIDIAAAALGDEQICWAMLGEPELFHELLDVCTDLFIRVAKAWTDTIPDFAGGQCIFGLWAPGTVVRGQCDNAALMSPRLYKEFLVRCDERICQAFDYPLIHTHSGFIDMVADALLGIEKLRAIQISIDYPAGPPVLELLPALRKINQQKSLVITGAVTQHELDVLLESLSPAGLCLQVGLRP